AHLRRSNGAASQFHRRKASSRLAASPWWRRAERSSSRPPTGRRPTAPNLPPLALAEVSAGLAPLRVRLRRGRSYKADQKSEEVPLESRDRIGSVPRRREGFVRQRDPERE